MRHGDAFAQFGQRFLLEFEFGVIGNGQRLTFLFQSIATRGDDLQRTLRMTAVGLLALQTLRDHDVEVDAAAVGEALKGVREQLETLRALKMTLTSIGTSAKEVYAGLDKLRDGILARIVEAETELRKT